MNVITQKKKLNMQGCALTVLEDDNEEAAALLFPLSDEACFPGSIVSYFHEFRRLLGEELGLEVVIDFDACRESSFISVLPNLMTGARAGCSLAFILALSVEHTVAELETFNLDCVREGRLAIDPVLLVADLTTVDVAPDASDASVLLFFR